MNDSFLPTELTTPLSVLSQNFWYLSAVSLTMPHCTVMYFSTTNFFFCHHHIEFIIPLTLLQLKMLMVTWHKISCLLISRRMSNQLFFPPV